MASPSSFTNEDEIRHQALMEWNAAASGWKKYRKDMLKWMAPVSDQIIRSARITLGQTVLDVATGTGEPALTIARIVSPGGRVVGVDLSPQMLEVAKQEAACQGLANVVEFQAVKDENLSIFSDNMFDAVVCRNGLMFMPDPLKALKAFHRVLKPRGKAAVTVWGSSEKSPVMQMVMKIVSKHVQDTKTLSSSGAAPRGAFSIPSIDMLHDYFSKARFSDFSAEKIEATVAQTDTAEQLWQGIAEVTGPLVILLSKLPEEKKLGIKNDAIESIGRLFPSGGPVKVTGELILGAGTKQP